MNVASRLQTLTQIRRTAQTHRGDATLRAVPMAARPGFQKQRSFRTRLLGTVPVKGKEHLSHPRVDGRVRKQSVVPHALAWETVKKRIHAVGAKLYILADKLFKAPAERHVLDGKRNMPHLTSLGCGCGN